MKTVFTLLALIYALLCPTTAEAVSRGELIATARHVKAKDERAEQARIRADRVEGIKRILTNTPLAQEAESFMSCAEQYGVSYKLLLAISWKESSFGRFTPKYHGIESYNAWGWGIHQGMAFANWSDGICTVAKGLSENYNHQNIYQTIMKYAPPVENNTALYIAQVKEFMSKI